MASILNHSLWGGVRPNLSKGSLHKTSQRLNVHEITQVHKESRIKLCANTISSVSYSCLLLLFIRCLLLVLLLPPFVQEHIFQVVQEEAFLLVQEATLLSIQEAELT